MAKSSGTTRTSSASNKSGGVISASLQELKGYGDLTKGLFDKQTKSVGSEVTKNIAKLMSETSAFIEKYTSPQTNFVEKEFWKEMYKISNNTNYEVDMAKNAKGNVNVEANNKAGKYINQSLDMMKVLAGKYHGVKIYDKSLANFKLKPLSEIKKK